MNTNKLKLKRTPEEEAQRRLRKEQKKERKRKRKYHESEGVGGPSSKRFHEDGLDEHLSRKWASSDEDEDMPGPRLPKATTIPMDLPTHAHKPDYHTLLAEIENQKFREKMFDVLGDDERLDSLEARFNDFAHVPDRWRTGATAAGHSRRTFNPFEGDDLLKLDPGTMDEEEYAEWIRAGMYRKTHAEEYAEQERQKAAKAARRAEEKGRKAETARLEKEAEEERKRKKLEKDSERREHAREEYTLRWVALLSPSPDQDTSPDALTFHNIPWPIMAMYRRRTDSKRHHDEDKSITIEDLTADAISSFLLPAVKTVVGPELQAEGKKERKEKLRETLLRFHPDKFEGRFMNRVVEKERDKVREAIGQVSRVLNALMDQTM